MIARFQVDGFEPRQVAGLERDWFSLMTFAKTFTSGIVGKATTLFMSAGTEEGSRSYLATERISARRGPAVQERFKSPAAHILDQGDVRPAR
jgi:hypothetical protein